MRIFKCDICKKTLTADSEIFHVSRTGGMMRYASFELCDNCGKPIAKLLKSKGLIQDRNKTNGRKK